MLRVYKALPVLRDLNLANIRYLSDGDIINIESLRGLITALGAHMCHILSLTIGSIRFYYSQEAAEIFSALQYLKVLRLGDSDNHFSPDQGDETEYLHLHGYSEVSKLLKFVIWANLIFLGLYTEVYSEITQIIGRYLHHHQCRWFENNRKRR